MDFRCTHFAAARCRSCELLQLGVSGSADSKQSLLLQLFPDVSLQPMQFSSTPAGSRIRARLAVNWQSSPLTFGFFDQQQRIVPIADCPLHHPLISAAVPFLAEFIQQARLSPYDPDQDSGELKFVVLTAAPDSSQLMVQWVLRSQESISRIRSLWNRLSQSGQTTVHVMGAGIQSQRTSRIGADLEFSISQTQQLEIRFGELRLFFSPGGFVQTNHEIATRLYAAAGQRIALGTPGRVLDLYCGSGGFGLMAAMQGRRVLGLEKSQVAVENACTSAAVMGLNAEFRQCSLDASLEALADAGRFSTVICNPPRRGLDPASRALIQALAPQRVLYSSCSPQSLARDIQLLAPQFRPCWMQGFDMFPLTEHFEVLCELEQTGSKS